MHTPSLAAPKGTPNAPHRPSRHSLRNVTNFGSLVMPFNFKQFDVDSIGYITLDYKTFILKVDARGPKSISGRVVEQTDSMHTTAATAAHAVLGAQVVSIPLIIDDKNVEYIQFNNQTVKAASFTAI